MPKTYAQLLEQMETLSRQMEMAKRREGSGVLKEIKKQIALYGFTQDDVFGESNGAVTKTPGRKRAGATAPKYQDAHGNSWSGRGPRPAWLRVALENGETLESFLSKRPGQSGTTRDAAAPAPARKRRTAVKPAAAKKVVAKKPRREVKASGKKAKAGAAASDTSPKQGRRRAAAPKAVAKPAAKKRRFAKASPARQVAAPTAAAEASSSQASEA
ncbi:H-NS histone family protein [Aquabacterium sp. A7-Y]|uniref:H-NS histone family protein n=1 Tax=Aquabacterium sp. A7-Y TaxID=1349605 RepID=UPI00223CA444|nr:H-NS histone family protein [Aquabacterium sp. A7-Y]MCW7536832.1 H-NS histone family protein [Aquabacterium sp. A7-Y]